MIQQVSFPSGTVDYLFNTSFDTLWRIHDKQDVIIITDEYIARAHAKLFHGLKIIALPCVEHTKDIYTIGNIAKQLLEMEATRKTTLIGVGGGVVTDITGFLAAIYMRGVPFGFVPTTLLGMVDAAVGGKNGVNVGMNKNILGSVRQPAFILYDMRFLDHLPDDEWSNGFAEIIKYACIFDAELYKELNRHNLSCYRDNGDDAIRVIIEKCVNWKNKTVLADEKEHGIRKLLNFGHTAAHAIENLYEIPHGKAVGIGMIIAAMISTRVTGLEENVIADLKELLTKYHLPVTIKINAAKAMEILRMDKKRVGDDIDYILLEKIGKGIVRPLPFDVIEKALSDYASNH